VQFLQILAATLLVGLISLIGAVLLLLKKNIQKTTVYFIGLASGSLLGTAFFHLIPESLERVPSSALPLVGVGVFVFFVLEKALIWRHCHLHHHPTDPARPTAARMLVLGDAAHNFLDGMIIASAFAVSTPIGISVTAAVILHEIPQELGDFAILLHGGFPVSKALLLNGLTALFALAGAVLTHFFIGMAPAAQNILLPVTAGGFLYIALADLIPQLHEPSRLRQTFIQSALLVAGFCSMALLKHN
jgi:zinc and cadmium transporter